MKKIAFLLLLLTTSALAQTVPDAQVALPKVERFERMPKTFVIRDWKKVARDLDSLIFNYEATGEHLPLIWVDDAHVNSPQDTFGVPPYVGAKSSGPPNHHEVITDMLAVLGASKVGIDKSKQDGKNYVAMCESFFSSANGENVFLNNHSKGARTGGSFWYNLLPNLYAYQLASEYPKEKGLAAKLDVVADRWYEAEVAMGGRTKPYVVPNFDWTGVKLTTMQPHDNKRWREGDAAGAIAWIEYLAYVRSAGRNQKYLRGAKWGMDYLNNPETKNPYYECLLPYGAYTAARMNAELGTNYDTQKLLNWILDGDNRRRWGVSVGKWNGANIDGLAGSVIPNHEYVFALNTFLIAANIAPIARYENQYARAIGKWLMSLANTSRLYYRNAWPDDHQTCEVWSKKYDPTCAIAYEGLLQSPREGKKPQATGDPLRLGWGKTNLGLYGSAGVGLLAAIVERTNVERILQLDLVATDTFPANCYPTYLYYNPYTESKSVKIKLSKEKVDLYDAVANRFVAKGVSASHNFVVPADAAVVLVVCPAEKDLKYKNKKLLIGGAIVDYHNGKEKNAN